MEFQRAKHLMLSLQLKRRGIEDHGVLDAMARVPRERFVVPDTIDEAYADRALPLMCGQTISQPFIVGLMTQALDVRPDQTVLEIGTGSGYQTAVLAELASEVVSLERHAALSKRAGGLLDALGYRNVELAIADGSLGWPDRAPFDRIMITAAATRCPAALFEQLREGGILVVPVGGHQSQSLQAIRKEEGMPRITDLGACRFVPLVGAQGWPE